MNFSQEIDGNNVQRSEGRNPGVSSNGDQTYRSKGEESYQVIDKGKK